MKPFDLEKAKAGAPICARDGRPAKFIAHVPEATECKRVVVLVGKHDLFLYYESGRFTIIKPTDADLFMAPIKREGWVCKHLDDDAILYGRFYPSEAEAVKAAGSSGYKLNIFKIEWEE